MMGSPPEIGSAVAGHIPPRTWSHWHSPTPRLICSSPEEILEHVLRPDLAVREIARVLRFGGAHVFTVPVY